MGGDDTAASGDDEGRELRHKDRVVPWATAWRARGATTSVANDAVGVPQGRSAHLVLAEEGPAPCKRQNLAVAEGRQIVPHGGRAGRLVLSDLQPASSPPPSFDRSTPGRAPRVRAEGRWQRPSMAGAQEGGSVRRWQGPTKADGQAGSAPHSPRLPCKLETEAGRLVGGHHDMACDRVQHFAFGVDLTRPTAFAAAEALSLGRSNPQREIFLDRHRAARACCASGARHRASPGSSLLQRCRCGRSHGLGLPIAWQSV